MRLTYCFDIDGTLCSKNCVYDAAVPHQKTISHLNNLYDMGHIIILMTARGAKSGIDWTDLTKEQLSTWGVKYHELIMNKKPHADVFVDDRAVNIVDWRLSNGLGE